MSSERTIADHPMPGQPPTTAVRWRGWPARDNPVRTLLVGLGLLLGGLFIFFSSGQAYPAILAVLALAGSMWRFFLPVVFQLDDHGIGWRLLGRQRQVAWNAIARYEVLPRGLLLFPHQDRALPASLRGLYVPCGEHHDAVLQLVKKHLDAAAA